MSASNTTVWAQQVNAGLYPTAVPDSFEVRVFSDGAALDGLLGGATFTFRWESAAGGVMNHTDIQLFCVSNLMISSSGYHDVLGYRYITLNTFEFRPMAVGCAITTEGIPLFGFRIRELSGCHNVELVQNAYTGLNNLDYWIWVSPGGSTGEILTDPLSSGDCPPCEPPVITEIGADSVPYCGNGVNLWSQATGTLPDHAWYRPNGTLVAWQPQLQSQLEPAGTYTLVVSNACGADTAQVEAVVDPGRCVPVAIDSAWATPWSYGAGFYQGIQLHAASSGSCPQYTWVVPWGDTLPANVHGYVNVPNPTAGDYTLIASNACGSDTSVLHIEPPQPCATPTATAAITTNDSCRTRRAYFTASATGPGPITTRWYDADGQLITGSPTFSVPYVPWGTYTFTATNHCGTDTVTVFHGAADTTGLADCAPPQILSLSAPSAVACLGDTVDIVSSTFLTGPCPSLVWSNVEVLSTSGDTVRVRLNHGDQVMLTATNGCGQVNQEVPIDVIYPLWTERRLCGVAEPLPMDSLLAVGLTVPGGGQWWLAGVPHNGIYDPEVDTSAVYQYHVDTSGVHCKVADLLIREFPRISAGGDTAITVCRTDPPFPLFGMLGGEPDSGGAWSPYLSNGLFDPAADEPGVYTYGVRLPYMLIWVCHDYAHVEISVQDASTWYADLDGDGLGDPADTLLACEQPLDHVAVAGDECPEIFGTVGDPCDDGNPLTVNDVLGEDCACAGELQTGVANEDGLGFSLWPNPNGGDAFFLQVPVASGKLEVKVTDATGRLVVQRHFMDASGLVTVELPPGIGAGTYFVSIVANRTAATGRLVVVR